MIAQVQILEVRDVQDAQYKLRAARTEIIKQANEHCEGMVRRGGGCEGLRVRALGEGMLVVELLVNVCDSMGANVVNTIAEAAAPFLIRVLGQGRAGIRILSNLCTERLTMAEFRVPVKSMGWKGLEGSEVVARIIEA